jgi:serine/threonine protein kinase
MELDSYGIYSYFTGDIRNISVDAIQKVSFTTNEIHTNQGEFIFQTRIGEGSYGNIYSTMPDSSNQSYAIKIMEIRNTDELYDVLSEVIMNIILLEGTEHEKDGPYVPRIYEFGVTADLKHAIIRSERMTGTIFDYLASNTIQTNDRAVPETLLQIIKISEFLQSKYQFNHRDFHSNNIMYVLKNGKHVWRIIDLGASCMRWNGYQLASDSIFNTSRPCMHPGRDITFLITQILIDLSTQLSVKLKELLRKLITFPIHGTVCELNSMNCKNAQYKQWNNLYNVLNNTNVINPNYTKIKTELVKFLKSLPTKTQKLKRAFWNFTFRKPKQYERQRRKNRRSTRRYRQAAI